MANNTVETEKRSQELKHLGFVKIAALKALVFVSNLYTSATENSGSLRSGVGIVEGAVTSVLGPVYDKFNDVPNKILVFLDEKVDEAEKKVGEHAPLVKQVGSQAWSITQKTAQLTQRLVAEVRTKGLPVMAADVANKYEQLFKEKVVKTWYLFNQMPAVHMVAEIALPTAAHWSEKYNNVVSSMAKKGYTAFSYVPLVPIEKISKAFKRAQAVGKDE